MINFEINNYTGRFPDDHYRLFLDSWEEYFATGAQAMIPRETFDNLYIGNPFGEACFAAARDQDILIGSLAAIPFSVAIDDNHTFTAYQISVAMISPQYRRQGIFRRIIHLLTEHLEEKLNSFIFTFPNKRSLPGFIKDGYMRSSTIPTRLYFPSPFWNLSSYYSNGAFIIRPGKRKFHCRKISLESARKKLINYTPAFPHLIKGGDYLKWRYFQPSDSDHFHFHHLTGHSGDENILLISTEHRYGKRVFTVLLEVFNLLRPGEEPYFLPGLLMKLTPRRGLPLLYTNESHLKTSIFSPTWSISLPDFVNPRPIDLLIRSLPKSEKLENYFLQLDFATADWLGFL
jgi:Acetyltransferase (GNAT) domain